MDLGTVKNRDKLKPQREPYWHKLAAGQFLGFRPSTIGNGGTWVARYNDSEAGRKPMRSLGDFGHLPAHERFTAASAEAREWFKHLSGGGVAQEDLRGQLERLSESVRYAASNPPGSILSENESIDAGLSRLSTAIANNDLEKTRAEVRQLETCLAQREAALKLLRTRA